MKVYILANRELDGIFIAAHLFKDERIIDRFVNYFRGMGIKDVVIVSNKHLGIKDVSYLSPSEIKEEKGRIIDLSYVYDERKLKRLIKGGKENFYSAVMFKNKTKEHLDFFGCLYQRSEWNPFSQYYIEPWGEKIAFWLRKTSVTPNFLTFFNIIMGVLVNGLLFIKGGIGLIIFGFFIRIYHTIDVIDGQLARLTGKVTRFGKWIDGGGDRLVHSLWYLSIATSLYLANGKVLFLFVGLAAIIGTHIHNYLLLTSVAYFRDNKAKFKSTNKLRTNILSSFLLFFLNGDVHNHLLTIFAWIGKLNWFIIFYAIYYNIIWFAYFLFYLIQYLKSGDVREV